jgi:tetratricopeptide (TPR) repeat protein
LATAVVCLVSCSRDPKVVRQRYLESGNKYYDRGKYKEASLMYRNALKKDPKFGPAYYRLALVELRLTHVANAFAALQRAESLLPDNVKDPNFQDLVDTKVRLAEIYLLSAQGPNKDQNTVYRRDVETIKDWLLRKNPKSFEGTKLQSELALSDALGLYRDNRPQESKQKMEEAISGYRQALQIKPDDTPTTLALAKTLALYGEQDEAEQLYKRVIDKDKTALSAYTELYKLYIAKRNTAEAENVLKRAIATHPSDYNLQTLLAAHYFSANNRVEMTKVLNSLKQHFKDYPDAYIKAGDFYFRIGDADQAMKQYEEGMTVDKARKIDYQKRMIEVLIRQGKTTQAYEKDLEILKANPNDPEARGLKASFLLDKGDVNQAATELQSVVTAKPDNFVAKFNLGRALYQRGDIEQARQRFEEVTKQKPDYMPARLAITQIALRRGDYEGALRSARETSKINPTNGVSRLLEADALINLGKFDEARTLLNLILKSNPTQVDTLNELATLNRMQKRYAEADELFQKCYEVDPSNTRGLQGRIQVRVDQNQPDKAVQLIADEVAKHPERPDLRRMLAGTEMYVKHYDQAIADFEKVLDRYKDSPLEESSLYYFIGQAYGAKGDYAKALDNLKKASALIPSNTLYLSTLAETENKTGDIKNAEKYYRDALKLNPNDPLVLNNLAYLITENGGNLDEALTLAQKSKQQLPKFNEVSDTLGWIYLKKNMGDDAAGIFRELTKNAPENATFHYHYALALKMKGDIAGAKSQAQEALKAPLRPLDKSEDARIKDLIQKL